MPVDSNLAFSWISLLQGKGELFTYWLQSEDESVRAARNLSSSKTVYEGYKNNYFQPSTPQTQKRTLNNGKMKASPKTAERLFIKCNSQDCLPDSTRPLMDIIRNTDTVAKCDTSGNYFCSPFHSASKEYPQCTNHCKNTVHISLKPTKPVNGITQDVVLKTSSNNELSTIVKSDTNCNMNVEISPDLNSEPNDNGYETDALLVRCDSTGHSPKRILNNLDAIDCLNFQELRKSHEEMGTLNGNENKISDSSVVTLDTVI